LNDFGSGPSGLWLAFPQWTIQNRLASVMTMTMPSKALPSRHERKEEWSEIAPEERYIICTSSDETNGAYSMIEVVADHRTTK
jgi:hypothetical protein